MKERPILFSAPMVRAILAGTKTQTRRAVKHPALATLSFVVDCGDGWWGDEEGEVRVRCPYGQPGDRLWVREAFAIENTYDYHGDHSIPGDGRPIQKRDNDPDGGYWLIPHYRATDGEPHIVSDDHEEDDDRTRWRPSIHMPRWASRITLEIVSVGVERVQDISDADAFAEGIQHVVNQGQHDDGTARGAYRALWESINGERSWSVNPWVWVIEFHRMEVNSASA